MRPLTLRRNLLCSLACGALALASLASAAAAAQHHPKPPPAGSRVTGPAHVQTEVGIVNESTRGVLERGDDVLPTGQFFDTFHFEGRAGQRVRVEVTSRDFDTQLGLISPSDETLVNDDYEGETGRSVIETVLTEHGQYCVVVTSYDVAETGHYKLTIEMTASPVAVDRRTPASLGANLLPRDRDDVAPAAPGASMNLATPGRVLGVFVGIHPPGEDHMQYCDDDAETVYNLFRSEFQMLADDGVKLLNHEATVQNIMGALALLGERAGPDDMLVFFYSGHGGTQIGPADAQDPDGIHETLCVWDGTILDDELADALDASTAGRCLIVLDCCMSGGFAKDLITAPGRMGLFSSQEDVTSLVPFMVTDSKELSPFGGFLSAFFIQALTTHRDQADIDGNRKLTAMELDNFIQVRFVQEVQAANAGRTLKSDYLSVGGDTLFLQRPAIDRSVPYNDVLFTW